MAEGTLIDSNVLLDVLTEDPNWSNWSADSLAEAAEAGPLFINPIIFSEVSVRFSSVEALDDALPPRDYRREPLPWAAAFLAGKVFMAYRHNRGTPSTTLPDFFIGAHAEIMGWPIATADEGRFRTYFPSVVLKTP